MAKLTIENLTPEQALTLANWYEGQGEQDADIWFDINEVETPMTDVSRKGGCILIETNGDVVMYCK